MKDNGYVYVMVNPSMDGLVKIGKTERDPYERANELSNATGVPTSFIVVYYSYFDSCSTAEEYIHALLETKGLRTNTNREFFTMSSKEAIDVVIQTAEHFKHALMIDNNSKNEVDMKPLDNSPYTEIYAMAEASFLGRGTTLQDYSEAMKLYKKAAKLGSADAMYKLGIMYEIGVGCKSNPKKALEYYKQGRDQGSYICYGALSAIFTSYEYYPVLTVNGTNAIKCWNEFIKHLRFSDVAAYYCARFFLCICRKHALGEKDHRFNDDDFKKIIITNDKLKEIKPYIMRWLNMPSYLNNTYHLDNYICPIGDLEKEYKTYFSGELSEWEKSIINYVTSAI